MHSTQTIGAKYFIRIFFLALHFFFSAQAQVKTVIPAVQNNIPVTVTNLKIANINFDLISIPTGATIDSCKLQIVLLDKVTYKLNMVIKNAEDKNLNISTLYSTSPLDTVFSFLIPPVFVQNLPARLFNVTLSTKTTNDVNATFYPASANNVSNAPRLVVYYSLAKTPVISWASARFNAQHIAQTPNMFKGASPSKYDSKLINNFGDIQSDMVMYNNLIYIVSGTENNKTNLFAIDPVTRSKILVADNLMAPDGNKSMPLIDPYGRLYYFSENKVIVINLANNKRSDAIALPTTETTGATPSVGPDGCLYLVTTNLISAYSPYPQHQLIWQYSLSGTKSPVSINNEGTIAYVVSYDSKKIIAINANNGRKITEAPVNVMDFLKTTAATIPLINTNGYVYVPNKLLMATNIDIFDSKLNKIRSVSGSKISPLAMGGTGDTVYYVKDGSLFKCSPTEDNTVQPFGGAEDIRSLVTDRTGNVYGLGVNNTLNVYDNGSNQVITTSFGLPVADKAMVIAPDGSLYISSSSTLFALRSQFASDYTLSVDGDKDFRNVTFRGSIVSIPTMMLTNQKRIVGTNTVIVGNNVTVDSTASISIVSGGSISINNGFVVNAGATLSCKTGY